MAIIMTIMILVMARTTELGTSNGTDLGKAHFGFSSPSALFLGTAITREGDSPTGFSTQRYFFLARAYGLGWKTLE